MTRRFFVLGASGQGKEVASAFLDSAREGEGALEAFLDDDEQLHGGVVNGLPVRAGLSAAPDRGEDVGLLLGVGYPEAKRRVVARVGDDGRDWHTVVHPAAEVGTAVEMGRGILVQAGAVLTVNIRVDDFVTVNVGASVNHDCTLGRFATISPGARLGGNVAVGEGAFVGIGASVIQGIRIGRWSVVGAGAVVIEDVPPNTVVVGVPARPLERREEGWQDG